MSLEFKRVVVTIVCLFFLASLLIVAWIEGGKQRIQPDALPVVSGQNAKCVSCHQEKTPAVVKQWALSKHSEKGVACLECHRAAEKDPDAWQHEGYPVRAVVTPRTCNQCHSEIVREFDASHHAKAAQFVGSLDNFLGQIAEGPQAAANGCWQCHGSTVKLLKDEKGEVLRDKNGKPQYDPATWPNTGMGRVNLDGTKGSCTACHSRHQFSKAQARQPENCGKCHMGPDHPQIEIYEESKHGIAFRANMDKMNLDSDEWVVGRDYAVAPTCATCHMSATPNQPATHDVGKRISWTLRPAVSAKLENAEKRRNDMKDVCHNCHSPDFVSNFYQSYDAGVEMYNERYAKPAGEIMQALKDAGKVSPTPFDDEIEWTYYHLWHHEGRRARMGLSMQGPDYTQWHGFFEVAHRFYFELVPQAEELAKGTPAAKVVHDIMARPEHKWKTGVSPEEIKKVQEFYKERYGQ